MAKQPNIPLTTADRSLSPSQCPTWTRRYLLQTTGVVVAASASVSGCDLLSTAPDEEGDSARERPVGREAPELTRQVQAGELPPLEQRLPESPLTVEPTERLGVYGGAWRTALLGTSDAGNIYSMAGYENLLRWTPQWTGAAGTDELLPNVAERFETNGDATEFTFWLRPGMRWSDGEPFTADDVVFAVDDVLLDDQLRPVPPAILTVDGEPARIEKLDDYSFTIIFPRPSGLFLHRLPQAPGAVLVTLPKHYLTRFHDKYNQDVSQLVREEGVSDWVELFLMKSAHLGQNSELPSLWPWQLVTPFGEGQQVVLERNPYYWKTDSDGRQLPYLDRVVFDVIDNTEVMLLKTVQGEYNLEVGPNTRFTSPANKPVLARERDDGGYRFIDATQERMNVMCIYLNLAYQDETKRAIFGNRDFRIGLSHAINREELVRAALQGQAEPYQVAPLPESVFFDEEFATQYLEYDVDLANEYLDRDYPERNGDGIRLGPNGNPISFLIEFAPELRSEYPAMLELIREYWLQVGVDMTPRSQDRSLFTTRKEANEHDAAVWHGAGGLGVMEEPRHYVPTDTWALHAVPWGRWYSSRGADGEEPPEEPRLQMQLYDRLSSSADADEQAALMREIVSIAKEQFFVIGVARDTGSYFVAANDLHNLRNPVIQGWVYPTPGPTRPEQYFISS